MMISEDQKHKELPKLSLVVSVFNEEAILSEFIEEARRCLGELPAVVEYLFVNDGSSDRSGDIVLEAAALDANIKLINLSRNFGHEAAMIAGIDHSSGDAVICIDADLQHPLEKTGEMLNAFMQGYEIITMVRTENRDNSLVKRLTSLMFYRVLNMMSPQDFEPHASDYFLISKRLADIMKSQFRERIRFLRGYIQIIGFKKTKIHYVADKRRSGVSKYSLKKLFNLSLNAILGFSNLPLRIGILMGVVVGLFGFFVGGYSMVMKWQGNPPSGYTTIVVLISFLFAIQFFLIGIIGEYIGYIFIEAQKRPIYLVDTTTNCSVK